VRGITVICVLFSTACLLIGSRNQSPARTQSPSPTPQRTTQLAGKGMEFHSWKPAGKDWHLSLVLGANRNKTWTEVADPECTVVGAKAIEDKLSMLAVGEDVAWCNLANEPVPQSMVNQLKGLRKSLDTRLSEPGRAGPNLVH